jgi:hypothetical protein
VALLTPLALALRAEMDGPTFRAYHRHLETVPAGLAQRAIAELEQTGLRFMPTAPEIRHAAERARRQVLAASPYTGCIDCEDQKGYRTVLGEHGQKTVQPCPCMARYLSALERDGLREPLGALPTEAGAGDEQVYPTLDQLPAPLRAQIQQAVNRKMLR